MAGRNSNFRRQLLSLETLAALGPELTAERPFADTAESLLALVMEAAEAHEGVLFAYADKPAALTSLASRGFAHFPPTAVVPMLPRHAHAMSHARRPLPLSERNREDYLSHNGNVPVQLFRMLAPLRVNSKLVGAVALGRRHGDAPYGDDDAEAISLLTHYVALAVHNHALTQTLEHRMRENLRLVASLHAFQDHTLEAFAGAIDVKDVHTRGHSLRVGRYAAAIGEAMGLPQGEIQSLRAAGYLHDIGKVAVDKYLFAKPSKLEPQEFKEMADHTTVGHQIVAGVEFPWQNVQEVVRSHHERADGSGYPDRLLNEEVPAPVRIVAVADCFDAMTSERPYRKPLSVGEAASQIVRSAPDKFDGDVVQSFLIQLRRDSVRTFAQGPWVSGSGRDLVDPDPNFLSEGLVCNISPVDVDNLASMLNHRVTSTRVYSA